MLKLKCSDKEKFVLMVGGERVEIFWEWVRMNHADTNKSGNWLLFAADRKKVAISREPLRPGERCGEVTR